jgi:hypothetical protein
VRRLVRAASAIALVVSVAPARAEIFVCASNSIRVFADGAAGTDAPVRAITGPTTGVSECYDVAYDAVHDEIVVAHGAASVFAGGASGDVAPLRTISGNLTGMGFAASIAVDTQSDELIVGTTGPSILVFARTANGNVPALRSFTPVAIDVPAALYVDRVRDEIVVSRYGSPGVVAYFDRTSGSPIGNRNPVPVNTPRGLYVDPANGALIVASADGVLRFDHGGALVSYLNYPPALTSPWGLAVMADTAMWVGNQSATATDPDALLLFDAGAQGSMGPISQINSGAPASTNLYGIASSRSQGCGAGHVACDSVFRANFDVAIR